MIRDFLTEQVQSHVIWKGMALDLDPTYPLVVDDFGNY